jgi:hypothetical protein
MTVATLLPIALPAEDNEAQAKLRAALEQQMNAGSVQPSATTPPSVAPVAPIPKATPPAAPVPATTKAKVKAVAPTAKPSAAAPTPKLKPTAPPISSPAAAPVAAKPSVPAVVAAPVPPAPLAATPKPSEAVPVPVQESVANSYSAAVAPTPVSADAIEKAQEALRNKMAEPNAQQTAVAPEAGKQPVFQPLPGTVPATPQAVAPERVITVTGNPPAVGVTDAGREAAITAAVQQSTQAGYKPAVNETPMKFRGRKPLALEPMPPPSLPVSASKAQRLQQLLQQYKADMVTPEQYHDQRAKILAEP